MSVMASHFLYSKKFPEKILLILRIHFHLQSFTVCRQGGGVINGTLYKYADVAEALPALPLSDAFDSNSMDIDD